MYTEATAIKLKNLSFLRGFCTRDRGRTDTTVKLLVFETSASTNSATRAFIQTFIRCLRTC